MVLGLAEDAVPRARQDHLGLAGPHGGDDDVRAHDPPLEGRGQPPAPLPERGLGEPHHLGRIGVDADHVRLERRALERGHQQAVVLAGRELVHRRLRARPRLLRLRVHALAQGAGGVQVGRLLEPEGGDAERADVILARERDHPAVPAGHVDDLAIHR